MSNHTRAHRKKQTHCHNGHELSEDNVYVAKKTGRRNCRECGKLRMRQYYERIGKPLLTERSRSYNSEKYFDGNREAAILRDGEKCVLCGISREQHRKTFLVDISVDHIDGNGRYTLPSKRNNNLDNLQTLCLPCHGRKDVKRRKMRELL